MSTSVLTSAPLSVPTVKPSSTPASAISNSSRPIATYECGGLPPQPPIPTPNTIKAPIRPNSSSPQSPHPVITKPPCRNVCSTNTTPRGSGFTQGEIDGLLDILKAHSPLCKNVWDHVCREHNERFIVEKRNVDGLKRNSMRCIERRCLLEIH